MFGLPFVFVKSGLLTGFLYLIFFAAVSLAIHLMYSDVITATEGKHRFVGYAEIYLGFVGKWAAVLTVIVGLFLTLAIYLILSVSFMKLIFPGLPPDLGAVIFWIMGSGVVVLSLARLANFEVLVELAMAVIIGILFLVGFTRVDFQAIVSQPLVNFNELLLPYGVLLFALSGRAAISSVREYCVKNNINNTKMRRAITYGTLAPAVVYILFVLATIWLSPLGVTPDAISGLELGWPGAAYIIGILGISVIWTSYFFLGLEAKDVLRYDFKLPDTLSLTLVVLIPVLLYFYNSSDLITFMGIAGGIFLALESIIVVLMRNKLKPVGLRGYFIMLVFLVGMFYEILKNFFLS